MGDRLGLQPRLVIPNGRERQTYPLLFLFKQMVQCSKASASEDPAASLSHHTLFTTQTVLQSLGNRLFFLSGRGVEKTRVHTSTIFPFLFGRKTVSASQQAPENSPFGEIKLKEIPTPLR